MKKTRVLIVDDELSSRTLLAVNFKKAGYSVYLARDGVEGYLKFFRLKPDLVLSDIMLPRMRGDAFIKWVKGTQQGKITPFIVISENTQMKEYLLELGVELLFEKPFKTKDVSEATKEIIGIYEEKRMLAEKTDQLKQKFWKKGVVELPPEHLKICEFCQSTVPDSSIWCPRCGCIRLDILNNSSTG